MKTVSETFDKHSLAAVGHVAPSKSWVLPAMEEHANNKVMECMEKYGLIDKETGEVLSKDEPTSTVEEFLMPFGKYKGMRISDVPDNYLLWLSGQPAPPKGKLGEYIADNIEAIKANAANE